MRSMMLNPIGGRPGSDSVEQPGRRLPAATPRINQIALLNQQIGDIDRQIEKLARKYPEIPVLRSAPGVGPIVAAAYVYTLDRPHAASNRSAGAFPGLRPSQSQSGESDPQRRISKAGDTYLRSLLVQSAQYILGRFGPDSALRCWGLKLAASGGKRGNKQAIVAVARKLAVLLHSMWRSGQSVTPFPQSQTATTAAREHPAQQKSSKRSAKRRNQSRTGMTATRRLAVIGRALDSSPYSSPSSPNRHRAPTKEYLGSH